jgi:hypothetical protein
METFQIQIAKYTYSQEQIDFVRKCVSDFDPDEIIQFKNEQYDAFCELKDGIMDFACKMNNLDLFTFFVTKTTTSFEEAVEEIYKKMKRDWEIKLTLPEAKELVKPKYDAIILLLENMKGYF